MNSLLSIILTEVVKRRLDSEVRLVVYSATEEHMSAADGVM